MNLLDWVRKTLDSGVQQVEATINDEEYAQLIAAGYTIYNLNIDDDGIRHVIITR